MADYYQRLGSTSFQFATVFILSETAPFSKKDSSSFHPFPGTAGPSRLCAAPVSCISPACDGAPG